jgi:hypothetical protein
LALSVPVSPALFTLCACIKFVCLLHLVQISQLYRWLRTSACSPAPSLALLLTDLGCRRPRPSLPHHTHTTRHNFAITNTHTATKLPGCSSW